MNVYIIDLDLSNNARNNIDKVKPYSIQEGKAKYDDIGLWINDSLNLHNDPRTIYVLRKTGHYDIIYKNDTFPEVDLNDLAYCDLEFNRFFVS